MSKRILFNCSLILLFTTGCTTSNVVSMGSNVHTVSSSGAGFDTGGVRSNVYNAANKFCAKSGQTVQSVSYESVKGKLASHPPSAELMFKCVNKSDKADLVNLDTEKAKNPKVKNNVERDIYTELMKLNELKEKGIISEKEFKTEKEKVLNQ